MSFTELTFWNINVMCYASAITLIEIYMVHSKNANLERTAVTVINDLGNYS